MKKYTSQKMPTNMLVFFLCCLFVLITVLSWSFDDLSFLCFVSFLPVFFLVDIMKERNSLQFTLLLFFLNLVINILVFSWLFSVSYAAGLSICFLNSLVFTVPYFFLKSNNSSFININKYLFLTFWVAVEFFHFRWSIAFPLLNLGYCLSSYPNIIQFYEVTGSLGGTFWVLLTNILLYDFVRSFRMTHSGKHLHKIIRVSMFFIFPILISRLMENENYIKENNKFNVLVVHPSIDCENEKYNREASEVTKYYLSLLDTSSLIGSADLILLPETSLPDIGFLHELDKNESMNLLSNFVRKHKTPISSGAISYSLENNINEKKAHENPNLVYSSKYDVWYKVFNSFIQLDSDYSVQHRAKENLVPIEETLLKGKFFSILRKLVGSRGGFFFSREDRPSYLFELKSGSAYAPIICYESAFSNILRKSVLKGAEFITVGLNECWYKNTSGAKHFLRAASIRAIETRKYIVRSSNMGYSSVTNLNGHIIDKTFSSEPKVFLAAIHRNGIKTFFVKNGDWLGYLNFLFMLTLVSISFYRKSKTR
ncbi:apolipoprotein N-acyltransferase [Ekhidna sp.]